MQIPLIIVREDTLPIGFEVAVCRCYLEGINISTEYHGESSRDCTMIIEVQHPTAEPRIHRCFNSSPQGLLDYADEVLHGLPDGAEHKLSYAYHDRLTNHGGSVDQIQYMINKLIEAPHTSRAQGITWDPQIDTARIYAPCLQRIWVRIVESNSVSYLNMNTHWRSRDGLRAAFMNMYAMVELQRTMAERIGVEVGKYIDISDSFHIYSSCYDQAEGFVNRVEHTEISSRTWTTEKLMIYAE